ncbi:MAG: hypothetical protein EKK55_12475 [Rhodocyclaceae bacterium]|nr:MAG: hypothetical protein EKK55_12475 [Rhodocyclaceae bacterium]
MSINGRPQPRPRPIFDDGPLAPGVALGTQDANGNSLIPQAPPQPGEADVPVGSRWKSRLPIKVMRQVLAALPASDTAPKRLLVAEFCLAVDPSTRAVVELVPAAFAGWERVDDRKAEDAEAELVQRRCASALRSAADRLNTAASIVGNAAAIHEEAGGDIAKLWQALAMVHRAESEAGAATEVIGAVMGEIRKRVTPAVVVKVPAHPALLRVLAAAPGFVGYGDLAQGIAEQFGAVQPAQLQAVVQQMLAAGLINGEEPKGGGLPQFCLTAAGREVLSGCG